MDYTYCYKHGVGLQNLQDIIRELDNNTYVFPIHPECCTIYSLKKDLGDEVEFYELPAIKEFDIENLQRVKIDKKALGTSYEYIKKTNMFMRYHEGTYSQIMTVDPTIFSSSGLSTARHLGGSEPCTERDLLFRRALSKIKGTLRFITRNEKNGFSKLLAVYGKRYKDCTQEEFILTATKALMKSFTIDPARVVWSIDEKSTKILFPIYENNISTGILQAGCCFTVSQCQKENSIAFGFILKDALISSFVPVSVTMLNHSYDVSTMLNNEKANKVYERCKAWKNISYMCEKEPANFERVNDIVQKAIAESYLSTENGKNILSRELEDASADKTMLDSIGRLIKIVPKFPSPSRSFKTIGAALNTLLQNYG